MKVRVDIAQLQSVITAAQAGIAAQQVALNAMLEDANAQIQAQEQRTQQGDEGDHDGSLAAVVNEQANEINRLRRKLEAAKTTERDAIVIDNARNGRKYDGVRVAE